MKKICGAIVCATFLTAALAACLKEPPPPYVPEESSQDQAEESGWESGADGVTSPSPKESSDPAEIIHGLSEDGYWIFSLLADVVIDQPVEVAGIFHDKGDEENEIYRKLSLHAQDENYNVTAQYTLTVPRLVVSSPNFRIQNGTVRGNVHVEAEGFQLAGCTVEGDLTFATQELWESANLEEGTVTGEILVGDGVDAVTSASVKESANPKDVVHGLSEEGYWIFSLLADVTLEEDLHVEGVFHDKGDEAERIYRKLSLYAQDESYNVTAQYTLTVPRLVVSSQNFRIQNGTVRGDIYVDAGGFELAGATVEGNVYFASQELWDSALLEEGTIAGETALGAIS